VRCHNVHNQGTVITFVTDRMTHVQVRKRAMSRSFDACKEYGFRCYDESRCSLGCFETWSSLGALSESMTEIGASLWHSVSSSSKCPVVYGDPRQ